ncbi:MAG: hypothetical protein M3Y32_03070 [Pseudomonadota bacterium]|nr:hypothetical protein [Pseudomonadota bacterium]
MRRDDAAAGGSGPAGWTAGSEEGAVTTQLQPVRLSAGRMALLVQQAGGFEHVKRRQDLYTNDGAKLERLWSAAEGAGPAWSTVAVVPADGGQRDDIIHLQGLRPGGAGADTLSASRLTWDAERRTLASQPLPELPALVAGTYASVKAAKQAASKEACLADYWVLPAERLGGEPSRWVLAAVAADTAGIRSEAARPCGSTIRRRAAAYRPTGARPKE